MHSVIFHLGKLTIHSYGLMLAISFLAGILLTGWFAKKRGLDPNVISDAGFWIIISAIIGSRLYFVLLHFEEFRGHLLDIINPFQGDTVGIGGLVMYGGFIGAVLAGVIFFKIKKIPFLPYADVSACSIALGIFLTRIGCFLNGCCYGMGTTGGFGVIFPVTSPAGYYQNSLHADALLPSQLFESIGGLVMLLVIFLVGRKKVFDGFEFYLVGLMYAILRFVVDFTRYYSDNERIASLSHNQIVCIVLFIVFAGLILKEIIYAKESIGKSAGEKLRAE